MLTIFHEPTRQRLAQRSAFCDGLSRRSFLTIGGSLCGMLNLPNILQAESVSPTGSSHRSLINIYLPGGPPHQDMWDLKPDAPAEVRGEFNPIDTNVPGIQICELFPELAKIMDKLVILRSIVGARGPHYAVQCMTTGVDDSAPSLGAWVSRLEGSADAAIPPHLSLCYSTTHKPWGLPGEGGFLGSAHGPYPLVGKYQPKHAAEKTSDLAPEPGSLSLSGATLARLIERRGLLEAFDVHTRSLESQPALRGRGAFVRQAWDMLSSTKLVDALDYTKEDPKIVERYGLGNPEYKGDAAPRVTENFLVARRLVEAGARVVSLNFSRWDWHGSNFAQARTEFPLLDRATSALVRDLHERGLDEHVTVIIWGEFGRTPKINDGAGRDHWPRVNSALMACGGMQTGQFVGATDKQAGEVVDRPLQFGDVHATLFHNLGIDPHSQVPDIFGRLHHPVALDCQPIAELI